MVYDSFAIYDDLSTCPSGLTSLEVEEMASYWVWLFAVPTMLHCFEFYPSNSSY